METTALSNTQLEILKAFSHKLNPNELDDLRDILADFFAKRAIKLANEAWDKNNWDNDKMDEFLKQRLRKSK